MQGVHRPCGEQLDVLLGPSRFVATSISSFRSARSPARQVAPRHSLAEFRVGRSKKPSWPAVLLKIAASPHQPIVARSPQLIQQRSRRAKSLHFFLGNIHGVEQPAGKTAYVPPVHQLLLHRQYPRLPSSNIRIPARQVILTLGERHQARPAARRPTAYVQLVHHALSPDPSAQLIQRIPTHQVVFIFGGVQGVEQPVGQPLFRTAPELLLCLVAKIPQLFPVAHPGRAKSSTRSLAAVPSACCSSLSANCSCTAGSSCFVCQISQLTQ